MNGSGRCCRGLIGPERAKSPFAKVIAFGYYDGPTLGLVQCAACARAYHFVLLDSDAGRDLRIFGLAPLPATSFERLVEALSRHQAPHWPVWVPLWQFPSESDRRALDGLTRHIFDEVASPEFAIATADIAGEILAGKAVTAEDVTQVEDWFSFLNMVEPHDTRPGHDED
jgi:hypothetical protein